MTRHEHQEAQRPAREPSRGVVGSYFGVRVVLELGPGRSLAKLIGESQPEIVVRSVADFRSWPGVIDWLQARLRD